LIVGLIDEWRGNRRQKKQQPSVVEYQERTSRGETAAVVEFEFDSGALTPERRFGKNASLGRNI
jgi:hypothetical protein